MAVESVSNPMSIQRQSSYQPVHELGTRVLWGPTTGLVGGRIGQCHPSYLWSNPIIPIDCQSDVNSVPIRFQSNPINPRLPTSHHSGTNTLTIQSVNPLPIPPIQCQSASPGPIHQSQNNPGPILCQSSANLPIACQSNNSWPIHQSTANPISIVYQSTNPLPIVDQFRNPTANVPIKCETWINLKPFTNLWHINPSPIERQSSPIYSQSNHSNSNPMSIKCQSYTNRKTIVRLTWEQVYYRDWLKCLDGGWIGHNWQANPMQNQIGTIIQPSHTSPKYVSPMPIHANLGSTRTDTS